MRILIYRGGNKKLVRKGRVMREALRDLGMAFLRAIAEADNPFRRILRVVGRFFDGFRGNVAQALIRTLGWASSWKK